MFDQQQRTSHRFSFCQPPNIHADLRQVLHQIFSADTDQAEVDNAQWTPHVDITEDATSFLIQADIPGVDPKDIELQMDKNILTIKAARASKNLQENEQVNLAERKSGTFVRKFTLPETANSQDIAATGKNGVLNITIPKHLDSTPRRITVV